MIAAQTIKGINLFRIGKRILTDSHPREKRNSRG
jgi:hypothetical protein